MNDVTQVQWIELSRDDFLSAIKRLRPERMGKRFLAKTLEIGLQGEEATFSVAQPRASGRAWCACSSN
jgi:hypothetical protein